jgi:Sortase domain
VLVTAVDGTTRRFRVTAVDRYPKPAFPTSVVYAATPDAELRLITCGGAFDAVRRSYTDNVVVSARLVG